MWIFPALLAAIVSHIHLVAFGVIAVGVLGALWLVLAPRRRVRGRRIGLQEEMEEIVDDLKHPLAEDDRTR